MSEVDVPDKLQQKRKIYKLIFSIKFMLNKLCISGIGRIPMYLAGLALLIAGSSACNSANYSPALTAKDYENARWARVRNKCVNYGSITVDYSVFLEETGGDEDWGLFREQVRKKNEVTALPCDEEIYLPDLNGDGRVSGRSAD